MALTDATRLANFGSGIGTDSTLDLLNVNATGIVTAATLKVGTGITMDSASGIITATKFVGPMEGTLTGNISGTSGGLSGTPDITVRNVTGVAATFTGAVTVGGVLTYEDVTNIDSVGIVTARSGIVVSSGVIKIPDGSTSAPSIAASSDTNSGLYFAGADAVGLVAGGSRKLLANSSGITINNGDLSIDDKIIHSGDTNTAIRFPAADTFAVETAGTERVRIDSSGRLLSNTTTSRIVEDSVGNGPQGKIQIEATNSDAIMSIISAGTLDANRCGTINLGRHRNGTVGGTPTVVQDGDALGSIAFSGGDGTDMRMRGATIIASVDGTPGSNDMPGRLMFSTRADGGGMSERLRITSGGGFHFTNGELIERAKVTAGKLSDNTNIDLENGMVHLFTTQETTTSTPNIRINSSTSLNSVMAAGEMISVTLITTAAAAGYSAQLTIDGGSSGVDIHAYTIIKTADATFTVVATQTKTS